MSRPAGATEDKPFVNCVTSERADEIIASMAQGGGVTKFDGEDVARLALTYMQMTGHGLVVADHIRVVPMPRGQIGLMFFFRGCSVYSQDMTSDEWRKVEEAALGRDT
jgi:hypothetical protein